MLVSPVSADGQAKNQDNSGSKYKNKEYVRVTEAISMIAKKIWDKGHWVSPLDQWMINKFPSHSDYQEHMRLTAERGSRVDDAVKRLLNGEILPASATEGIEGYLAAFEKFRATWGIVVASTDEEVVDEELKLVGTLDIYGTLSNGLTYPESVIDVKTGEPGYYNGEKTYPIYDEMNWQTAAYRKMKNAKSNWILRLFNDGEYRLEADQHYERSLEFIKHGAAVAHLKKHHAQANSNQ